MPCWDGGSAQRDENESEQESWADPLNGEVPGQPQRHVNDPEPWKPADWTGTPEERMHRDMLNDDDDADGA